MTRLLGKFSSAALALLLNGNVEARTNFLQDEHIRRERGAASETFLMNKLMERAQPYQEEEHFALSRRLEDRGDDNADDDASSSFGSNLEHIYDFSNYSLKYSRCQIVQRFSERAVKRGEYSAMTKDSLVILRMCPSNSCSSSNTNGCNSGYGEYVISLKDYLSTMMEYETFKRENMCDFCSYCDSYYYGNRRKLGGSNDNKNGNNKDEAEDEVEDEVEDATDDVVEDDAVEDDGDDDADADEQQENQMGANNYYAGDDYYSNSTYYDNSPVYDCDTYYQSTCSSYADTCSNSVSDYSEYLSCVAIQSDNSKYYLGPYCDGSAIIMGIFYDPYCVQYAGNSVSINSVSGMSFTKSEFESYYDGTCISCDSSDSDGPFGQASNYMCNQIYEDSAKCNSNMAVHYDNTGYVSTFQKTVCEYTSSILNDAFDSDGSISSVSSKSSSSSSYNGTYRKVSAPQIAMLVLGSFLCIGLALYACYLHHEITNLLLKQLSMRGKLLPKPGRRAVYDDSASESGDSCSTGSESAYVMA